MVLSYEHTLSESSSVIELSRPDGFLNTQDAMCLLLRAGPIHSLILLIHERDDDLPEEIRQYAGEDCFGYMAIQAPLKDTVVITPDGTASGQLQFTKGFQTCPSWLELPRRNNIRTVRTTDLSPIHGDALHDAPRLLISSHALLPESASSLLADNCNVAIVPPANVRKERIWSWINKMQT